MRQQASRLSVLFTRIDSVFRTLWISDTPVFYVPVIGTHSGIEVQNERDSSDSEF